MKKVISFIMIMVMFSVMALFTACSTNNQEVNSSVNLDSMNNTGDVSESKMDDSLEKTTHSDEAEAIKIDTGTYIGQIDNNSIEVKISGIQDDQNANRVFVIADSFSKEFQQLPLNGGEEIKVTYTIDEYSRNVTSGIQIIDTHPQEGISGKLISPYSIIYNGNYISVNQWDNEVDIKGILGKPLSESVEKVGEGGDTYAGSYMKTIKYDGLSIDLMSPAINGKTFFIVSMNITSDKYLVADGVRVGDSIDNATKKLPNLKKAEDGNTDISNSTYVMSGSFEDQHRYMNIDISNNIIKTVKIGYELQ